MQPLFLLSLPRSGSTLVQRMLAANPDVATAAEPWVLLSAMYGRRYQGVHAEYGHRLAVKGVQDFVATLDGGEATYRRELRAFIMALYEHSGGEARYFLDKTPRYSLIIDDIASTFPDATFVILWRNPLAVVSSIVDTFLHSWLPQLHAVDLYTGLANLVDVVEDHPDRVVTLCYETVVAQPTESMRTLSDALGLTFSQDMVDKLSDAPLDGRLGDRWGAALYDNVSTAPVEKWHMTLAGRVRKRWALRYLDWIGHDRLAVMGYDLDRLRSEVRALPNNGHSTWRDALNTVRGGAIVRLEPHRLREKLSIGSVQARHYYS